MPPIKSDTNCVSDYKVVEQASLLSQQVDVEKAPLPPPPISHEHTVSTRKKLVALFGYFVCNVGLTLYNKAVLGSVRFTGFDFRG